MLDFSTWLDLPFIWALLIAAAVFLYVCLDGFDLGVGILYPFAPSHKCRDKMMNSVAPFWDGNETWLVLGGGGLLAAFPVAYSIIMPALYVPVILMLLGLILRGVAFEFRFKATETQRWMWDSAFHYGSLTAAFMQGVILANFVQGVEVEGRAYAGGPFDWVNWFSLVVGLAVVSGYVLLGATWTAMKTTDETRDWARKTAIYGVLIVALFMGIVSLCMPFIDERIYRLWFTWPNILYLAPVPLMTLICTGLAIYDLRQDVRHIRPFFLSLCIFTLGYLGLGINMWPWVVPFEFTVWEAAAAPTSLSLLFIGTATFLPLILVYTAYCYYVFRGKSGHEPMY